MSIINLDISCEKRECYKGVRRCSAVQTFPFHLQHKIANQQSKIYKIKLFPRGNIAVRGKSKNWMIAMKTSSGKKIIVTLSKKHDLWGKGEGGVSVFTIVSEGSWAFSV